MKPTIVLITYEQEQCTRTFLLQILLQKRKNKLAKRTNSCET